jgi:hypothetical protein
MSSFFASPSPGPARLPEFAESGPSRAHTFFTSSPPRLPPPLPAAPAEAPAAARDFGFDDEEPEEPVDALVRHWRNERCAPELLDHCSDLLDRLVDRLDKQVWSHFLMVLFWDEPLTRVSWLDPGTGHRSPQRHHSFRSGSLPLDARPDRHGACKLAH